MLQIILSGPRAQRHSAITALQRAGVGEGALRDPDHGFHPKHVKKTEGWVAYHAESLDQVAAAEKHGYRLRLHRDARALPIAQTDQPPESALQILHGLESKLARLEAQLRALKGEPPPIAGGSLESPPFVISADSHPAYLFRQTMQSLMSGTGVVNSGDLAVSAPGGMNVSVAAGLVWIPGTLGGTAGMGLNVGLQSSTSNTNGGTSTNTGYPTTFTSQSNYLAYNDATVTLAISAANPTNPRIDLVCASVQDAQYSGAANQCVLQVVTGTAAATPAPPVPPASSVVLASVWVPAGASSIVTADINDLRSVAQAGGGLKPLSVNSSVTALPGQLVRIGPGTATVTLPASAPTGALVGVAAGTSVTGASPITVAASGGSSNIFLPGSSATVSSFLLGAPGAFAVLCWSGSNWITVAGGEDTGWVALTLGSNITSGDAFTPSCRRVNGTVYFKGTLSATGNNAGIPATVPAGYRPPSPQAILNTLLLTGSGVGNTAPFVTSSGNITTTTLAAGCQICLNGCSYSVS